MSLVAAAGVLGLAAVALGAFGAHGLRVRVAPEALELWRTAALYHLVHAVALLAVALGGDRLRLRRVAAALFMAGITVFSGSLYLLALTGARWLGAVTPLGGAALIAGWLAIALGVRRASG